MTTSSLRKAMKEASTIYWNVPKDTEPAHMQTVLVVYDNQVWPGVYANRKVVLYPEDFGSVLLEDCQLWAALPTVDPVVLSELQAGRLWCAEPENN